jgi:hypothetical protein
MFFPAELRADAVARSTKWFLSKADQRAYVAERLERWRTQYGVEKNPRYAWLAYDLARDADDPIPEWVLAYLDSVAYNISLITLKKPKRGEIARRVLEAVGFTPGGVIVAMERSLLPDSGAAMREKAGAYNPFSPLAKAGSAMKYSEQVANRLKMGDTLPEAKKKTAECYRVSVRTVERGIEQYPLPRDTK